MLNLTDWTMITKALDAHADALNEVAKDLPNGEEREATLDEATAYGALLAKVEEMGLRP